MRFNRGIILGILILAVLALLGTISLENKEIEFSRSMQTEYAEPISPRIDAPIPNAEKLSVSEAQSRVTYEIPVPSDLGISDIWVSKNGIPSEKSVAVKFNNDVLLIVHHIDTPPDWDQIITSVPQLVKINVNGNPGVGTNPGHTTSNGRNFPHPGSVGWWVDGLRITIYSDTLSLDALLKIAETVLPASTPVDKESVETETP